MDGDDFQHHGAQHHGAEQQVSILNGITVVTNSMDFENLWVVEFFIINNISS